jgi:hypothetical protein
MERWIAPALRPEARPSEVARAEWLATAKDPRFGRFYTDLVYQPMLELLDYLRANEFKSFIVSGTGADFICVFAEETYRIPPSKWWGLQR